MEYLIGGVIVVVWLGLLMYLAIKAMDERFDNSGYKWTIGAGVFLAITFATMMYLMDEEVKECESKGGQMVKTGAQTTYIMSGTVMVPTTTDKYDCTR